jgi:hypothetical protein
MPGTNSSLYVKPSGCGAQGREAWVRRTKKKEKFPEPSAAIRRTYNHDEPDRTMADRLEANAVKFVTKGKLQ